MKRSAILVPVAVVIAAAAIVVFTGRLPSRIAYEVELERARNVLRDRQTPVVQRFRIGEYDRFNWSQEEGLIVFSTASVPKVVADIQFVGSYSDTTKTWLWAWANGAVLEHLTGDAKRMRAIGEKKGWEKLTTGKWAGTEEDGWCMATLQAAMTDADMAYRTPFDQGKTYLTLKNVRWAKPGERFAFVKGK
jgi:hypothetical protein